MSESHETPVGQSPASGGRVKQYASAAERARAHRERQKRERPVEDSGASAGAAGVESSVTTLAFALGELERHRLQQSLLVDRIEAAIAQVTDPVSLDIEFESIKTHSKAEVANALATAADAKSDAELARVDRGSGRDRT